MTLPARLLRVLFAIIALAGLAAAILPWVLLAITPRFPGVLAATIAYVAIVAHRLWVSFLRMPDRARVPPSKDWTAIAVGLSYACVIYAVLIDLHHSHRAFADVPIAAAGAVLYLAGVVLEMWALRRLGAGWSIQLDAAASTELLRDGPYAWVRHPIYTGAMVEAVGIALLFGSWWALVAACVLFCPSEIARALFEERFLRAQFGPAYDRYARHVRAFVPIRISDPDAPQQT